MDNKFKTLRIPENIHRRIKVNAIGQNISMGEFVIRLVNNWIAEQDKQLKINIEAQKNES
jgi:predicted HicB family RNase H-like nuclease